MSLLQALVLGMVQGLSEFLPISSSAHLALVPWLLRWPDQGLAYDVALHWGTLAALFAYFREDFRSLTAAALRRKDSPERRLAWGIALATVPAGVAGLLAEDYVEGVFRAPERIALALMAFGLLLAWADRRGRQNRSLERLGWRGCLLIGLAQALALAPGVSRSGITLTAGLLLGLPRVEAARFSFLLSAPIVLAAGLLKIKKIDPAGIDAAFWLGIAASALTGFAAIRFLLGYLKNRDLGVFAAYRLGLGLLILGISQARPPVEFARELKLSAPRRPAPESLSPPALRLRKHVQALAGEIGPRSAFKPRGLDKARDYIARELGRQGTKAELVAYRAQGLGGIRDGAVFHNIVVSAGPKPGPGKDLWVVGAHYDSDDGTPGADDNASGSAVLLELARTFKERPPAKSLRLVFYSTEEAPGFGTRNMGSYHDAQALKHAGIPVAGMLGLEMLGYYDPRPGSQVYAPFLKWLFPAEGDFLGAVGNLASRRLSRSFARAWRRNSDFPLVAAALPELELIRLSDHANYWDAGFPALMLTDTAFLRNPHYHQPTDTPETLDYERMAAVAEGLARTLREGE